MEIIKLLNKAIVPKLRQIVKLGAFQKDTNYIVNYFAFDYGDKKSPEMFRFPFFVDSETFRKQINLQNSRQKIPTFSGNIVHICYDASSNRLYFPEITSMQDLNTAKKNIVPTVERLIQGRFNTVPDKLEVLGNPYRAFRVRKLENFFSAVSFIQRNDILSKVPYNPNLLVVEADLSTMPKTVEFLKTDLEVESLFIGQDKGNVPFIRNTGAKDYLFYQLQGPFILVNLSPQMYVSEMEKERVIIKSYKDYVESQMTEITPNDRHQLDIFNIKYFLLLGWSTSQLCQFLLDKSAVNTIDDFCMLGSKIVIACDELKKQGYKSPLRDDYYYIIRRTKQFPTRIPIFYNHPEIQNAIIRIVSYDASTELITLTSKLHITEDICQRIFFTDDVTVFSYLADIDKFRSPNNVLTDQRIKKSVRSAIKQVITDYDFDPKKNFTFEKVTNDFKFNFTKRKVSDYYQLVDQIKKICTRTEKITGKSVPFDNLNVYIGPFSRILRGVVGAYQKSVDKPVPLPAAGITLYPRDIIIDTDLRPSVADIYDTIVHEYCHDVGRRVGIPSPDYEMPGADIKKMLTYLNSPDERESHVQQCVYLLSIGLSKDQIIQRLLRGLPDFERLEVALKYSELIDEAAVILEEISQEEQEGERPK